MIDIIQTTTHTGITDNVLKINNDSNEDMAYSFGNILENDDDYTFSCWMKSDTNTHTDVYISDSVKEFALTPEWTRVVFTSKFYSSSNKTVKFSVVAGAQIYAYEGQLEHGNKATDFRSNEKDITDSIQTVDEKLVVLQTDFSVEQGKIESLIKETTIDNDDGTKSSLKDKYLETVATVDGMKTTIGDVQTTQSSISSKVTEIEATTEGIKTNVSNVKNTADSAKSTAEQTATKFNWIVKSGSSATDFTLTDRTASLVADYINLNGKVTFSGLDSSAQNKINTAQSTANSANSKIDNLQIGGRNLFVFSGAKYDCTKKLNNGITNTNVDGKDDFRCVIQGVNGTTLTTISTQLNITEVGHYSFNFYISNDYEKFVFKHNGSTLDLRIIINKKLEAKNIYTISFDVIGFNSSVIGGLVIDNIKLEKGNKATDWTPAPEDKADQSIIDNWAKDSVVNGETVINGGYIKTNTIKTDQLAVDDIFATGSSVMNIINAQEINANRITSGQLSAERINVYGLSVLNKDNNQQTFNIANNGEVTIKGSVSSSNYNIGKTGWAIINDGTAEFNDIIARGSVITNDGGIANSGSIRFWAGTSYEERESAPFIVYNDGSIRATQGEFGGVFSGIVDIGNIRIVDPSFASGGDALLTIQDGGSGLKRIQLTDGSSSIFAQDLIISNNTYSPMVTLKQDGTALFDRGINIGDSKDNSKNVILNKTSLIISNKELTTTSTGFLINSNLDVGSSNNIARLTVHGDTISDSMTLANELNFGGVVKFTTTSNGINIDFVE